MPAELRRAITSRVQSGNRDEFDVIDRGIVFDHEAGEMHCVLEAPDVNAVVRHHESLQVPVGRETIHRADAILK